MDGRRSTYVAGALLSGLLGCTGPQTRPPAEMLAGSQTPSPSAFSKLTQSKNMAPVAPPVTQTAAAPTKLKPSTLVSVGTLKEQVAEDAERPQQERDAARQQARQSYQKAIELDSKYVLAYVALGRSYAITAERDRSQAMFAKAQALAPNDASIPFEQGQCLARNKEWEAAAECLSRAAKMDPDNKQCQKWLGFTLARSGRYDDGLAAFAKCMPEAEARFNLARMLKHNQQSAASEQQLRLALKADPNFEQARAMLSEFEGGGDTGVRTTSYEGTSPPVTTAPTAPATPSRLMPVTLGGNNNVVPPPPPIGDSR